MTTDRASSRPSSIQKNSSHSNPVTTPSPVSATGTVAGSYISPLPSQQEPPSSALQIAPELGKVSPEDRFRLDGFFEHRRQLEFLNRRRVGGLDAHQVEVEQHNLRLEEALILERPQLHSTYKFDEEAEEKKRDEIKIAEALRMERLWETEKLANQKRAVPRPFSEEVELDLVPNPQDVRVEPRNRNSTFRRSGSAFLRSDAYSGGGGSSFNPFGSGNSNSPPPPPNFNPPGFQPPPPDSFEGNPPPYEGNYYPPNPGMDQDNDSWGDDVY